jgi:hypothetical protein
MASNYGGNGSKINQEGIELSDVVPWAVAMTSKELILQEMAAVPEPILAEVLDFLRFLKATRLAADSPTVTIVSPEGDRTVALDALQQEIPERLSQNHLAPNPVEQVRHDLIQALSSSGYLTKESIVELVRDVKQEMLTEFIGQHSWVRRSVLCRPVMG